jgi:hypothetical protein
MGSRYCNVSLQEQRWAWWRHKALNKAVAAAARGRPMPSDAGVRHLLAGTNAAPDQRNWLYPSTSRGSAM